MAVLLMVLFVTVVVGLCELVSRWDNTTEEQEER